MITINTVRVLNLLRRTDRREHIQKQFESSNILRGAYEFFEAVDGHDIDTTNVNSTILTPTASEILKKNNNQKQYGVDFTDGSFAILLTYIKLFEELVHNNHTALVFEDDICLESTFDSTLKKITNELPENFDLCYLGYCPGMDTTFEKYSDHLSKPVGQLNCLYGFIVSPSGSEKLLQLKPYNYQIDTEIYLNFDRINVFCSTHPIVNCTHEFISDAQI